MDSKTVLTLSAGILIGMLVAGGADRKTKLSKALRAGFEAYTEDEENRRKY